MSDGRVVRSGAGDAAARSTAEAGPDGKVHVTHTISLPHGNRQLFNSQSSTGEQTSTQHQSALHQV